MSISLDKNAINSETAYTFCTALMLWLETQENVKTKSEDMLFLQRVKEMASGSRFSDVSKMDDSQTSAIINVTF